MPSRAKETHRDSEPTPVVVSDPLLPAARSLRVWAAGGERAVVMRTVSRRVRIRSAQRPGFR
jgi:hypothetical protein